MKTLFKETDREILVRPIRHGDHRGFFAETYSRKNYFDLGIDLDFVQDNHSLSKKLEHFVVFIFKYLQSSGKISEVRARCYF